ncbi:hypothetical protein MRX96_016722 [Rhipicephalus microplus]
MKYIEEFPAADPDQSDHSPPLQVVKSASVLDPGIPLPDLLQEILSSRSLSFEDMEALHMYRTRHNGTPPDHDRQKQNALLTASQSRPFRGCEQDQP